MNPILSSKAEQDVVINLPEGWASFPLREIARSRKGKKPMRVEDEQWPGAVPYIDIETLETGMPHRYADSTSSVSATPGDIAVVWDGARCGLVGKVPINGALGSTLAKIEFSGMNSAYVFHFLQSQFATINSNPRGTGIPHVEPSLFWDLKLPLCSLAEQKRIVAKIEELLAQVNAACTRLARASQALKRFRQAVFVNACTGRLTEDWREMHSQLESTNELFKRFAARNLSEETRKNNGGKQINKSDSQEHLPKLPDLWSWVTINEFADVRGGIQKHPKRIPKRNAYPYLRVANVLRGKLDLTEVHKMELFEGELENYRLKRNDLLVVEGNGSLGEIGRSAIWNGEIDVCIHQNHIIRVRPRFCSTAYLNTFWNSPIGTAMIAKVAVTTAGLYNLSTQKVGRMPIPLPPLEEQHEIVRRVEALFKLAESIEKRVEVATRRANKLSQGILAKAFRGELVPTEAELARRKGRDFESFSKRNHSSEYL